jgi:GMP synthase-like glutamine amidotransferase
MRNKFSTSLQIKHHDFRPFPPYLDFSSNKAYSLPFMNIHIFQHVPFEGPAKIEAWLKEKGHRVRHTRFYEDATLPLLKGVQGLVIMGGPMGANDEEIFPWMAREKSFIKKAVEAGLPVLGVCLGAQLIAATLGARVYPNKEKEIGWFPIELSPEGLESGLFGSAPALEVFHWHGDTFDLPPGATRLAKSQACLNQAFLWGRRVLGLQFHLEMGQAELELILENCGGELETGGTHVQGAQIILDGSKKCEALESVLDQILGGLFT